MKVAIEVTADDIARGEPKAATRCPIALATMRATDLIAVVNHFRLLAYRHGEDEPDPRWSARMPDVASKFARDFDDGLPVSPFAFEVDIPEAAPC